MYLTSFFIALLNHTEAFLKRLFIRKVQHAPNTILTAYKAGSRVQTSTGEVGTVVKVIRQISTAQIKFYSIKWDKTYKSEKITLFFPADELSQAQD